MGDFQAHGLSYQGRNAPENDRRDTFIHATKTCNLWVFFTVFRVFLEKHIKNILQEMKYGLSLRQEQLQVIM